MKKYILNPHLLLMGFFVLIIISSGSSVKAQVDKKMTRSIIISNGDTIVNGKKMSEADKKERIRLREEFNEMEGKAKGPGGQNEERVIIRRRNSGEEPPVLNWNDGKQQEFEFRFDNKMPGGVHVFKFDGNEINVDTLMKGFNFKMDGLDSNLRKRIITMHRNFDTTKEPRMSGRIAPPMVFERRMMPGTEERNNVSSFNYNHIDKDGIPSRMNIRISDAEKEQLKKITGSESLTTVLEVEDLTLFPNFSNGKLGLSFNMESRGAVKIKILDSQLNQIYADEAANFTGNYMKQIDLPKNGIYYISIKQNTGWFVRKLIKN
ncbi:Por secretion system C-terminal sorting domain-containing protein [Daejeonella rubra]|uniref:Por secretion system C-terminal sorting domain-containing protein n=1 Tax=Daejeonella rubra TaxID=990371 RepID=A0A1G9Q182_9SPHI|nr:T9SS type A sorting domain-containing protein [Daejeonella rubra]SDM04770.1 Por secretion system C-terminal sorting domain-containing protein [Daejeonella rubra]